MKRYWGMFSSITDMRKEFGIPKQDVKDREVLFACYEQAAYDGEALVLFQRGGKLYEVSGSHCSCYGLENQWHPKEVTWDQLAMRKFGYYPASSTVKESLMELIRRHVPRA